MSKNKSFKIGYVSYLVIKMNWLWLILSINQFWNTNFQSLINSEVAQLWH